MRYGLNLDRILLVARGVDDLGDMLKLIDWGVGRNEMISNKKHRFQERPELDCPAMARVLGVFAGTEAEVESKLDQVHNMAGFWVGESCHNGHYGVYDTNGDGFLWIDMWVLD